MHTREMSRQQQEFMIGCGVLNKMTGLGMPESSMCLDPSIENRPDRAAKCQSTLILVTVAAQGKITIYGLSRCGCAFKSVNLYLRRHFY